MSGESAAGKQFCDKFQQVLEGFDTLRRRTDQQAKENTAGTVNNKYKCGLHLVTDGQAKCFSLTSIIAAQSVTDCNFMS